METDILKLLEILRLKIATTDISWEAKSVKEWGGADVIIKKVLDVDTEKWQRQEPLVINIQNTEPKRRVIVTKYSKELSWLFYELKIIFSSQIDYLSKYDLFGSLAQTAIDYLKENRDTDEVKDLLFAVLNSAERFYTNESSS